MRSELLEPRAMLVGDLDFAAVFGSAARDGSTIGEAIAIDPAGNRYVTGSFSSDVDFDFRSTVQRIQPTGEANAFIAKYAADGRLLWLKNIGGSGRVDGKAISVDVNYNVYVAGYFTQTADFDPGAGTVNRTSTSAVNTFLLKLTTAGNFAFVATTGAATTDHSMGLALDPAGAPVVAGSFAGTADFDPGPGFATRQAIGTTNAFVWKLTPLGSLVYATTVSGEQNTGNDLDVDLNGNAILVGEYDGVVDFDPSAATVGQPGFFGAYVLKLDAAGQFASVSFLDGDAYLSDVAVDSTGNIYSTGVIFSDIIDFDPGPGTRLYADFNNGLYFVWKLTSAGAVEYVSPFSTDPVNFGFANTRQIVVDLFNRATLVGEFFGVIDFDPATGGQILDAGFTPETFVQQLDALGNFLQVSVARDDGTNFGQVIGHGVALTPENTAVVIGEFAGSIEFDPGTATDIRTAAGNLDLFLADYRTVVGGEKFNQVVTTGAPGNIGDAARSVTVDASGNYFVAGEYSGIADFDPGPGVVSRNTPKTLNAFVAKYSPTGQLIWVKTWDGADSMQALQVEVDATNRVYVTGSFYGIVDFDPNAGSALRVGGSVPGTSLFVVRLDSNGNFQYVDTYTATEISEGKIDVSPAGEVVLAGRYRGTIDLDPNAGIVAGTSAGFSGFVTKLSTSGAMLWAEFLDATATSEISTPTPLFDSLGNVIVTGGFTGDVDFDPSLVGVQQLTSTDPFYSDMFILRLNPAGAFTSVATIGGTDTTVSHDAALDSAGNLLITGEFAGITDFDPGPLDGTKFSLGNSLFVAKYNPAGSFVYTTVLLGFGGFIDTHAIAVDAAGNAHVAGQFGGTIDFDPSLASDDRTASNNGAYLLKLNPSGARIYAATYDALNIAGNDVAVDVAGDAFLVGSIEGTADFDPKGGTYELHSNGDGTDIFFTKLLAVATGTLTADLIGSNLFIDDVDPVGRNNQLSVSVLNGILQITDPVERFQTAPAGGSLSPDRRTMYLPIALVGALLIDGQGGDDQFLVTGLEGAPVNVVLDGGNGVDTFGSPTQPLAPQVNAGFSIFGGLASAVPPVTGNQPGDTLYLDLAHLPPETSVAVATIRGSVAASGHTLFNFKEIEDLQVATRDGIAVEMGDLLIQGGDGNDVIVVSPELGTPNRVNVRLNGDHFGTYVDRKTIIAAGEGRDLVSYAAVPLSVAIWGQGGDDALVGGERNDQLFGGDGNDSLQGQGGIDYLQGGAGNDFLDGGAGNDRLYGDAGNDQLLGKAGVDLLVGNAGSDLLAGGTEDDLLIGGADADVLNGNEGDDLLLSGETTHGVSSQPADLADVSLASLLFTWSTLHAPNMASAILSPNDQAHDDLFGETGDDDFYLGAGDLAVDFGAGDETF